MMPADRLLGTLLKALQTYTAQQDTPRLAAHASPERMLLLITVQDSSVQL